MQPDANFFDDDAFGVARAVFFEQRDRFLDRLACAQYFDAARFDAMLLCLETLKRFHDARAEPMTPVYFEPADIISNHLETQSIYSSNQKEACTAALGRWDKVLRTFGVRADRFPSNNTACTRD